MRRRTGVRTLREEDPMHTRLATRRLGSTDMEITTLGFGDITPATPLGRFLTSALALTGYAVIAVPTGILTTEPAKLEGDDSSEACPSCGRSRGTV